MATITPTKSDDNKRIKWANITNGDTADAILIASGKHTVNVRGTHDSEVIDIQHGESSSDMDAIDTDEAPDGLRFTAKDGAANIEISGGYVKPHFSTVGGGSEDITVEIIKID